MEERRSLEPLLASAKRYRDVFSDLLSGKTPPRDPRAISESLRKHLIPAREDLIARLESLATKKLEELDAVRAQARRGHARSLALMLFVGILGVAASVVLAALVGRGGRLSRADAAAPQRSGRRTGRRPAPTRRAALMGMAIAGGLAISSAAAATPTVATAPAPYCAGQYADDFGALSAAARDFDHRPEATFSYCTRNVAVYECLSYASDGSVRRARRTVTLHGTAFAYRKQSGDTWLLTNDHVGAWPVVTDDQHVVDGVSPGCKRVSETLTLVDDEHDSYGKDDISVTRVVTDPELDIAVLKARADLQVMPWKIGHSAGIRERNLVEVRGFPLGAFRATNIGKVISAHDHDDYADWDHDDFIVDALLSRGNSGSPVLGISCATGEYELVGVYHAGYSEGTALNAVIGIDQVRDLMATLKRAPRRREEAAVTVDAAARRAVVAALADGGDAFFPFGSQVALARQAGSDAILWALFSKEFPSLGEPALVLEDTAASDSTSFGSLGRIWLGSTRGLKACDLSALDADGQAQIKRALAGLRADLAAELAYRAAADAGESRSSDGVVRRLAKALGRAAASRGDLLTAIADLADKGSPQPGDRGVRFATLGRSEFEKALPATAARAAVAGLPGAATPAALPPR